ncbi:hypothetical protein [Paenibacillus sabinae]|uniref:HTH LytTR-type domain-containing protein n=1 Tax=Paenibacillus sabinae T27 TaxID=1268072 RepID=X4ZF77_9BACL|nr:hypothetical protein [Paenibacillus sabinae]AHV96112.1 hypothetical protein PSAB_05880 [Paenibacillus sabinae T27]
MKIPVVRMKTTGDVDKDFVEIDLVKDVNFVYKWQKTKNSIECLAFFTSNGTYLALTTLREASISFSKYGYKPLDSSTLVNLSRIMETEPAENGSKITFIDHTVTFVRRKLI